MTYMFVLPDGSEGMIHPSDLEKIKMLLIKGPEDDVAAVIAGYGVLVAAPDIDAVAMFRVDELDPFVVLSIPAKTDGVEGDDPR